MSNRKLRFSPQAEVDLQDIFQYTQQMWGSDQRRKYLSIFMEKFDHIQAFPESGRSRTEIDLNLRTQIVGSHVVAYEVSDVETVILRIVHSRMDLRLVLDSA